MDTQASELKLEEAMEVVGRHADGKLLAGRIGQVGVVLFNQPEKRNAMSLEMWDGVHDTLGAFAQDPQVRVAVYAGTGGKAFMAGSDISQFGARRSNADANEEFTRLMARAKERVAQFPKPSIACIQGFCIGVGMVVAISTALRVAAPDAQLGITAARMGIHFGLEPTQRLVSLVGPSRARLVLYAIREPAYAGRVTGGGAAVQGCPPKGLRRFPGRRADQVGGGRQAVEHPAGLTARSWVHAHA